MRHQLPNGEIVRARVEAVYPTLTPGSVTLVHSDGPYGLGKAEWDRVRDLADWYRPHVEAWTTLCAPSASVYFWNTAEGWAEVHPLLVAAGWTFRALVVWDKGIGFLAGKIDTESCRTWPDVTEVCGFYQREQLAPLGGAGQMIAFAAGASERNNIRAWLNVERERAGVPNGRLKALIEEHGGAGEMLVRHTFYESQWLLPTFEQWKVLHRVWNAHGDPAGRPYLQRDELGRVYNLSEPADHDALRAEYDALRAPFSLPLGTSNVWTAPQVSGRERLAGADGLTLHPCQKPLAFARRVVEASTRPGDLVLEPFGGTCRIAVACEDIAREDAAKARRYVCVEADEDGREYIAAVLNELRGERPGATAQGQMRLFGATK